MIETYGLNTVEVDSAIKRFIAKTPMLSRRVLSFISEAIVNRTVISHLSGQTLKRKTGTLAKSINYELKSNFHSVVGSNVAYAAIHESGGIIEPKNAQALRFKVKDQWITTKKVVIPQRSYLQPAIEYVMQYEAGPIMERITQEWIDEEWRK